MMVLELFLSSRASKMIKYTVLRWYIGLKPLRTDFKALLDIVLATTNLETMHVVAGVPLKLFGQKKHFFAKKVNKFVFNFPRFLSFFPSPRQ